MKIKVIGKQHMQGTSKKTGNPYDFLAVHYIDKINGGVGERGEQISLDPAFYDYNQIEIGKEYDVTFGRYGRVDGFVPVK